MTDTDGTNIRNAAQRFYQASHDQRLTDAPAAEVEAEAVRARAAVMFPGHRYSCAVDYLRRHPAENVCELGFGFTSLLPVLTQYARNYTIVDIVDRRGDAILADHVKFQMADLNEDFPFADNLFDVTIAMMVVEHLFDPFHSFRELARITKPGGKIFVNLPNIGSIRCRLQLVFGNMPVTSSGDWFERREWDGNHLHYFTISDVQRLASVSNLSLEKVHGVGKFRWLKEIYPSLLTHEASFEFTRN